MSAIASALRHQALTLGELQRLALWLFIASGWYVIVEPAPYEMLFALVLVLFLPSGLVAFAVCSPMIVLLTLYNIGGVASLVQLISDPDAINFTITSCYMALTAMFFAFCIAPDPMRRMAVIRNAYIIAGAIGAITGLMGYFNLAGMAAAWAPIWRAQGTFKDPNVLSTFLIPPAIFLMQGFLLGTQRWRLLSAGALLVMLASLFLAFSRGAWMSFIGAAVLVAGVTFAAAQSLALRTRIIFIAAAGAIVATGLLAFLLSFDQVRELFTQRAALLQTYDAGETGRFGKQLASIPLLLERPLGLAPRQFRSIFGQEPHNVYLNAFAAYGWLGGISYLLLIIATIAAGWKAMFTRTPWQHHAIAVFCPLFAMMLQGIQIDTDHWRHFYLLLGATWGLFAATMGHAGGRYRLESPSMTPSKANAAQS